MDYSKAINISFMCLGPSVGLKVLQNRLVISLHENSKDYHLCLLLHLKPVVYSQSDSDSLAQTY
jgi:hypothetical protein